MSEQAPAPAAPETIGEHIAALFATLFKAHNGTPVTQADLQAADDSITALKNADDAQFAALGARLDTDESKLAGLAPVDLTGFPTVADLAALADRVTVVEGKEGVTQDLTGLASATDLTTLTGRVDAIDADLLKISSGLDALAAPVA